jgi:KipI family sensor histidine kinase inhibitor
VTVLLVTEPGQDLAALAATVGQLEVPDQPPPAGELVIPVVYDGPDLAEVARLAGLTEAEVADRHAGSAFEVGWLGFAPGFGYLTGLDPALHVPRLATPRTRVPAGSVAIAGPLAAVYPTASPGGWRLIGRTSARLWDTTREPPAVFSPGLQVTFRPVAELPPPAFPIHIAPRQHHQPTRPHQPSQPDPPGQPNTPSQPDPRRDVRAHAHIGTRAGPRAEAGAGTGAGAGERARADAGEVGGPAGAVIEVVRPGPLATVQDLGRPGYGHLGVSRSGAADTDSLRRANELVGNEPGAAGIELTLGRGAFRFPGGAVVAVAGAAAPLTVIGAPGQPGQAAGFGQALIMPAGAELRVGGPVTGLRTYLAVRGGLAGPAELGSRSSDLLARLGPAPLRAGDSLPLAVDDPELSPAPPPGARWAGDAGTEGPVTLRVRAGPREDWFADGALDVLCGAEYTVTPASDRTGLRLDGPALTRARAGELPSEGMVTGALQVPPDGRPILLLADHGVTGGYPVLAVVVSSDVGRAAQLRPGRAVRFSPG